MPTLFEPPSTDRVTEALHARRERMRAAWRDQDDLADVVVLVPGGLPVPVEGTDQHLPFRAHDDHAWLAGCRLPGQVLVSDPETGWILFAHVPEAADLLWHGAPPPLDELGADLGLEHVRPVRELGPWLQDRSGRPAALLGSHDVLEVPRGYGLHPGDLEALDFGREATQRAQARVVAGRRVKDDVELDWLRAAAACTAAGHEAARHHARPGASERAVQVEIEAAFGRAGAEGPAYPSIVGGGPRAAVLHGTPGARALEAGDLLLVDAGAEVAGYDSDVTRTFVVGAEPTAEQRGLHDVVRAAQAAALDEVRPGVAFRDLHLATGRRLAEGLVDLGLLRGRPDDLVGRDAQALFFPHGLGHLLGLGTHDVGGHPPGHEPGTRPGLKYLRLDLDLQPGFVLTIEPGLYFVPAILDDPDVRRRHHDDVDWERVAAWRHLGGVRIEDDVHVTEDGCEVLTGSIPRDLAPAG